jgi:ABC-type multidrug transport system fused ATPase/permease subunit
MLRNTIRELPMKVGLISGIGLGIFLMIQGHITPGGLMAFITLIWKMSEPFNRIVGIITNFQNTMVKAKGLFEVMDEKEEDLHTGIMVREGAPQISFHDVTFNYNSEVYEVLRNVDFQIQSGSTVALVGPSGSGKSTLVRLLYRFYNPQAGDIAINGTSIKEYSISDLRKSMSIVSQDVFIFDGTIRENLTLVDPDITEAELMKALEYSQALEFVCKLPDGLDTRVGERGIKLSHGQKQRISIARAILKKSSIIILDEPTSALDIDTELSFQQSLNQWSEHCTKIIIAHRLSTIRDADYILFLEEGRIIEQGKPQELLVKGGRFKEYCVKSNIAV